MLCVTGTALTGYRSVSHASSKLVCVPASRELCTAGCMCLDVCKAVQWQMKAAVL
jgi:hypothetical protein